jgi:N-acylneuraminate cytidylyltransferase
MKIFVPIKEHSQRVSRKNFREMGGVPLYKKVLRKFVDFEVFVDTDSEEIRKEIEADSSLGHVTAFSRHAELIGDDTSVCRLITSFVNRFEVTGVVAQIHVTSPFLLPETLWSAKDLMHEFDSVVSCDAVQARLWRKESYGYAPINHNPIRLEQTQSLPIYFQENSSFYLFNSEDIQVTGNRIGDNPYFYIISHPESFDIDTEDDWNIACAIETTMQSHT